MSRRVVFDDDPYHRVEDGPFMEFRLTYDGLLFSTGNDSCLGPDKRGDHKHHLRMAFHPQLKRLWEITPFLKNGEGGGPTGMAFSGDMAGKPTPSYKASYLAKNHTQNDWRFVPLVTEDLELLCSIDVLMLRPEIPGNIIQSGDIDGRLKTLFDALSKPNARQGYADRKPEGGQDPTYVLLEDDKLVTKVAVETDQLMQIDPHKYDKSLVRLVITVRLRPYEMHRGNMQFG
jgi:hypothetical protein